MRQAYSTTASWRRSWRHLGLCRPGWEVPNTRASFYRMERTSRDLRGGSQLPHWCQASWCRYRREGSPNLGSPLAAQPKLGHSNMLPVWFPSFTRAGGRHNRLCSDWRFSGFPSWVFPSAWSGPRTRWSALRTRARACGRSLEWALWLACEKWAAEKPLLPQTELWSYQVVKGHCPLVDDSATTGGPATLLWPWPPCTSTNTSCSPSSSQASVRWANSVGPYEIHVQRLHCECSVSLCSPRRSWRQNWLLEAVVRWVWLQFSWNSGIQDRWILFLRRWCLQTQCRASQSPAGGRIMDQPQTTVWLFTRQTTVLCAWWLSGCSSWSKGSLGSCWLYTLARMGACRLRSTERPCCWSTRAMVAKSFWDSL